MVCACRRLAAKTRSLAESTFAELSDLATPWLRLPDEFDAGARKRLFCPSRTFWLFLSQILGANRSCREVVCKFLAWLAFGEGRSASPQTAAYCKARQRLPVADLQALHQQVAHAIESSCQAAPHWYGRRVKVVDGSSVSMPDTPQNQKRYPQPTSQKPGCGFPVMRILAMFSLVTGSLLGLAKSALSVDEGTLFRQLWHLLRPGDVVLADAAFASHAHVYLLHQRGIDIVMRNHGGRRAGRDVLKRLGPGDHWVKWHKTPKRPQWIDSENWARIPETLVVREIHYQVPIPGFRTRSLVVATTLLSNKTFPKDAFCQLYRQRWRAEIFLRDIKVTMGFDILRCKSPDMIEKELWMHVIAYNLLRALIGEAAHLYGIPISKISFQGTVTAVRQWAPLLAIPGLADNDRQRLRELLLRYIAHDRLPHRPNRYEPRAKKRRPKGYPLLTKPRPLFHEILHRNRYTKP